MAFKCAQSRRKHVERYDHVGRQFGDVSNAVTAP